MSTATYVSVRFQFWPLLWQRSNFQRQPVKQVVKSEESVKGMIKQVEVSHSAVTNMMIGTHRIFICTIARLQKGNRDAAIGNWSYGESSINSERWKCESNQPIHHGKLWRVNEQYLKIDKRKWAHAKIDRGTEKGEVADATIHNALSAKNCPTRRHGRLLTLIQIAQK